MTTDNSQQLQQQIKDAYENASALHIVGGNSKAFYGREDKRLNEAETLNTTSHQGVITYEPTELVITARAGTKLQDIEKLLDENGQMLPFEPPAFGDNATIGGTIACNLSGPRRAYAGAARDYLLGCKLINGKGDIMHFGGEVMKNVAGYDVSRLMAGALGTLGVLLEVSLKVLPKPETEQTLIFNCNTSKALDDIHRWSQSPLPVSATSFHQNILSVRLSGESKAVTSAIKKLGGEVQGEGTTSGNQYWRQLKEQQLAFFSSEVPLWRLSIASDTSMKQLPESNEDSYLTEWGGSLRWLKSELPANVIQQAIAETGGHAILFRANERGNVFHPLSTGLKRVHLSLKQSFDPRNIFNPGKLYADL